MAVKTADVYEGNAGFDVLILGKGSLVFRPVHELKYGLVHIHAQDVVLANGLEGLASLRDVLHALADRGLQVCEVDGLGEEIKGPAVHGRTDVLHIAIGGDDDGLQQG